MLRFFDRCQNYKDFRKNQEPAVDKLKEPIFDDIASALQKRCDLNFTSQDISSFWFLCKQEASLLDIFNRACGLFGPSESFLDGYGNALNYQMGVPLLEDVFQSMEQAIKAKEENQAPGNYEKARLQFAHAETVVPFSCLLGLFLEGDEFERIQKEEPLELPPKPPQKINWRGSIVAPFAGNNMLVLYSCPANSSRKYFVHVLHNEQPIRMPISAHLKSSRKELLLLIRSMTIINYVMSSSSRQSKSVQPPWLDHQASRVAFQSNFNVNADNFWHKTFSASSDVLTDSWMGHASSVTTF